MRKLFILTLVALFLFQFNDTTAAEVCFSNMKITENKGSLCFLSAQKQFLMYRTKYDSTLILIDLRTGLQAFDTMPAYFPDYFDERDSTFWLYSWAENQYQTGALGRLDKLNLRGDTVFTFVMPDTTVDSYVVPEMDPPVVVARPDGYTVDIYNVLTSKRIQRLKMSAPDSWEKVSSVALSRDLSRAWVKYLYQGVTYNLISGDSICDFYNVPTLSKDYKYFFKISKNEFRVYRSSDSSLYYTWKGEEYAYSYTDMKKPDEIFMNGTVFRYLDTLSKPIFHPGVSGKVTELGDSVYLFNTMRICLTDLEGNNVRQYSSDRSLFHFSDNDSTIMIRFRGNVEYLASSNGFIRGGIQFGKDVKNYLRSSNKYFISKYDDWRKTYTSFFYDISNASFVDTFFVKGVSVLADDKAEKLIYQDTAYSVLIYDIRTKSEIGYYQSTDLVMSCSPDGDNLLCSKDWSFNENWYLATDTFRLVSKKNYPQLKQFLFYSQNRAFCFSPDNKYFIYAQADTIYLVDLNTLECVKQFVSIFPQVSSIAMSDDGKHLVYGCQNGRVVSINPISRQTELVLSDFRTGAIDNIIISPTNKYVAASNTDGVVINWRADLNFLPAIDQQPMKRESAIVSIVPHPASGRFSVNIGNAPAGNVEFRVFDLFGNEMLSASAESNGAACSVESNSSRLPVGTYFYRVLVNGVVIATGSFVVAR